MAKSIELKANINDRAKLCFAENAMLYRWLSDNRTKDVVVTIELSRKKRSNPQNRYYWEVVVQMVQSAINDFGNEFSKDETHEFLKAKFNYKEIEITDGHYIDVPRSTTKLDTVTFMDYVAKIQRFATEMLGIYIPDPNQEAIINY
jgi:hypothetical protein